MNEESDRHLENPRHKRSGTASLSDVGRRRRTNQDACAEFPGAGEAVLLVCCDGMGGHNGGEVASRLAVATIGEAFAKAVGDPAARLELAFVAANRRLRERAANDLSLHGMGTTAVALYYDGVASAWSASVGDSRVYRVRGGAAEQLTRDHSVVAELLRLGRITPSEAVGRPLNQLARAIGAEDEVAVDTARHDARAGDRWLLCTDGLWNLVGDREIAECLAQRDPSEAVRKLVDLANERGGSDNITVQLLALADATGPEEAGSGNDPGSRPACGKSQRLRALAVAALAASLLALALAAARRLG